MAHWRREWKTTSVFLFENPMNSMKRQKDSTLKDELHRSVGAPYATGEITPERMKKQPKRKQRPVVDVTGDKSKVRCYKSNIAYEPGISGP